MTLTYVPVTTPATARPALHLALVLILQPTHLGQLLGLTLLLVLTRIHLCYSAQQFEQKYSCELLFTVPSLADLLDSYPEYFI